MRKGFAIRIPHLGKPSVVLEQASFAGIRFNNRELQLAEFPTGKNAIGRGRESEITRLAELRVPQKLIGREPDGEIT